MNKFWPFVLLLILTGTVLLVAEDRTSERGTIHFTDLETECRRPAAQADVSLREDNSLRFEGSFPESSTRAELDYSYRQTDERIILDVRSEPSTMPENFISSCLASVVYDARTEPIESGRYVVEVRHNGNEIRKFVMRVN